MTIYAFCDRCHELTTLAHFTPFPGAHTRFLCARCLPKAEQDAATHDQRRQDAIARLRAHEQREQQRIEQARQRLKPDPKKESQHPCP